MPQYFLINHSVYIHRISLRSKATIGKFYKQNIVPPFLYIMQSIIEQYQTWDNDVKDTDQTLKLTQQTPYLTLTGELWCILLVFWGKLMNGFIRSLFNCTYVTPFPTQIIYFSLPIANQDEAPSLGTDFNTRSRSIFPKLTTAYIHLTCLVYMANFTNQHQCNPNSVSLPCRA